LLSFFGETPNVESLGLGQLASVLSLPSLDLVKCVLNQFQVNLRGTELATQAKVNHENFGQTHVFGTEDHHGLVVFNAALVL
jgi:hypothetical protein